MPQLVDDLPRRDAALSRRACDEHVTAGPGGEIGERTGERRCSRPNASTFSADGLSIDGTMPKM